MKCRRSILPRSSALCGTLVLRSLPQRQRNRHFPAVAEAPELADHCGRCFPGHHGPPPQSTTAAEPVFSCRCGSPGIGRPLREVHPGALWSSAPCHNGSESRIFLPLRKPRNWPTTAGGASRGTPVLRSLPQRQRNRHFPAVAEAPELADPCDRHFPGILVLRPLPQRQRNPYFPAVVEIRNIYILSLYILGMRQYAENE